MAFGAPSGERTTGARCIVVAIDESTSMSSADRSGARADAVRATASFLATHGLDGDRLGTTWFAERASSTDPVPPQEAAPLDPPTTLGAGTSISAGLREAQRSLERGCGEATKVVVLVSDGEASGPGEFAAARNAVTSVDGVALHLIAMNEGGAFEPSRAFWEDPQLGLASIQTIDGFGRDEMAGAVAAILSMETGQAVTSS